MRQTGGWVGGANCVCDSIWQCPARDIRGRRRWTMSTMVAHPAVARRPPRQHQVKSSSFPPTEEEQRGRGGRGASGGSDCCVQVLGGNVGRLLLKIMGTLWTHQRCAPGKLKSQHSSGMLSHTLWIVDLLNEDKRAVLHSAKTPAKLLFLSGFYFPLE